ncbi:MAG: hypothetical protein NNA18_00770 [Nitrospira sp.]|nr:hypothetical protein [Nitrospira sp.]
METPVRLSAGLASVANAAKMVAERLNCKACGMHASIVSPAVSVIVPSKVTAPLVRSTRSSRRAEFANLWLVVMGQDRDIYG